MYIAKTIPCGLPPSDDRSARLRPSGGGEDSLTEKKVPRSAEDIF